MAFNLNTQATNTEVYGSLVYYGDASTTSGIAHGIYIQNVSGYKKAMDNIVFNNSGIGIHAYPHASDSSLLNVSVVGNILFNNGLLGGTQPQTLISWSGARRRDLPCHQRATPHTRRRPGNLWNNRIGIGVRLHQSDRDQQLLCRNDSLIECTSSLSLTGNTFYGLTNSQTTYSGPVTPLDTKCFP